jgi:glucokinase
MVPTPGDATRQLISTSEARSPFFVGVDVGGTSIKIGVVDDLGRSLSWLSIPTDVAKGPELAIRRMGAALLQAIDDAGLEPAQIAAVGLGTPGTLNAEAGLLISPSNLPGWWNFPIRDRLSEACGRPVTHVNDGNAAGYGEFWVGTGRTYRSMVLFTLGTGVGGSIIIGDLSIDGDHGNGAELGHTIIDYNADARLCSCGRRGHLEAYASATAVIRRTEEALAAGVGSTLAARAAGGAALTPLWVAQEADKGDRLALQIVLDTARYVGIAAVNVMHTVDPSGVVIGGAMTFGGHETGVGRQFLACVKQVVGQLAFPLLAEQTTIDFSSLGGDAGYIGAAGLARLAARKN